MKDYATRNDITIVLLFIVIGLGITFISNEFNHKQQVEIMQGLKQTQDSIATHIHYMDSVHYSNCSFTANEKFKPYTP
jgi:hypothetical protein